MKQAQAGRLQGVENWAGAMNALARVAEFAGGMPFSWSFGLTAAVDSKAVQGATAALAQSCQTELIKRTLPGEEFLRGQAVSIADLAQAHISLPHRGNDIGLHPHAPALWAGGRHVGKGTVEAASRAHAAVA